MGAGACAGRADGQVSVLGRAGRACWGAQGEHAGARGMSGRRAGALAATRPCWPATRPCWPATRPRGHMRHCRGASCDTAEGPAATRSQCVQCARPCTAWAWRGRWVGVLAGSTGPSWCTVHLAQF